MLQIEREIVQRENAYTSNEIDNRRLEQLHTQLQSFNLQATLIVGFALSTLNADNLVAVSDDLSKFCVYKQPFISGCYFVLTIFSIGTCMTCLGLSFYIIFRSQKTANEVSVKHTVALVRRLQSQIFSYYMVGMCAFFGSLLLLIWMYVGQRNWVPLLGRTTGDPSLRWATGSSPTSESCPTSKTGYTGNPACDSYMANGWDTPVVNVDDGSMLVTCLNPYNSTQQAFQRDVGVSIATAVTITFVLVGVVAFASLHRVRGAFRNMCELPEVKAMAGQGSASTGRPEFIQMLPPGSQRSTGAGSGS